MSDSAAERLVRERGQLATLRRAFWIVGQGVRVLPWTFAVAVLGSILAGGYSGRLGEALGDRRVVETVVKRGYRLATA